MTMFASCTFAGGQINVSPDDGGCGSAHQFEIGPSGYAELTCAQCEDWARRRDDRFVAVPVEVPLSHDEQKALNHAEKTGKTDRERQMQEALIRLSNLDQLPQALAQVFGPLLGLAPAAIAGKLECPSGHANDPGQKFCGECGQPMHGVPAGRSLPAPQQAAKPSKGKAAAKSQAPLPRIRDARLDEQQDLCRAHGLDDTGTRAELINRLAAAGITNKHLAEYREQQLAAA